MSTFKLFLEQYRQNLNEYVEYSDDYGEYQITKVIPDDHHEYRRSDGIGYELGTGENIELAVSEIEHTPENQFYEDQIERYIAYIEDGGMIESFPVQHHKTTLTRSELLERVVDYDEWFDWAWDFKKENNIDYEPEDILNEFDDTFNTNFYKDLDELDIDNHLIEDLIEGEEESWTEEQINGVNQLRLQVKELLDILDKERKENADEEYTLTDMNHRFEAVKRIGVNNVWVELV